MKPDALSPEYIDKFQNLKSVNELAEFLNLKTNLLEYLLYYATEEQKYKVFKVKKRNGKFRTIYAPTKLLKEIQGTLQDIFQYLYLGKPAVHGFTLNKSIISNARLHINKRIVVNIDLKDFFLSITTSKVKNVFLGFPFNFNEEVASALTKICCNQGSLPQGAPTSPALSNFVCRMLDNEFMKLSKISKVCYTRYADDITFSTNLRTLHPAIGIVENNHLSLGKELLKIINNRGFLINKEKIRYALKNNRQEVTGLIVNKKLNVGRHYIKNIRSMLNAWEKFGLSNAACEHFLKHNPKNVHPKIPEVSYEKELVGKINFVGLIRGKDDFVYEKLFNRIKILSPSVPLSIIEREVQVSDLPILLTEGKTDIKHIKAAYNNYKSKGLLNKLELRLHEYREEDKMSNGELLKICQAFSKGPETKNIIICLFDRDDPQFIANVTSINNFYKHWGNNVYSLVLPVPPHRNFTEVCIEHFYTDKELVTEDAYGRRIYLGNEFNRDSGIHKKSSLIAKQKDKLKSKYPQIIDNGVIDDHGKNYALSKNKFAEYILNGEDGFSNFNFDSFSILFENILNIIELHKKNHTVNGDVLQISL